MKHAELLDENCAIARSSGIVGERWVWVILRQAFNGARRFEDYQRGIGLARNVLTDRLNWLVDHTILERRPYAEHRARDCCVDAEVRDFGNRLIQSLMADHLSQTSPIFK